MNEDSDLLVKFCIFPSMAKSSIYCVEINPNPGFFLKILFWCDPNTNIIL